MKRRLAFRMETCSDEIISKKMNEGNLVERNFKPLGVELVNPRNSGRRAPDDLVELAKEIQKGDSYIKANACNKLQIIAEQMQFLQKQAESVLFEAKRNSSLHHVACNFIKQPGKTYHLYRKDSGQRYFSMLNPEEWGNCNPSQTYEGSFRLEFDHSWTPVSEMDKRDREISVLDKIYQSRLDFNTFTLGLTDTN